MKQEMTGWQWREPDHMQIIWTSLQTDKHASTSSCWLSEQVGHFACQVLKYHISPYNYDKGNIYKSEVLDICFWSGIFLYMYLV